jgi:hypothetical protein
MVNHWVKKHCLVHRGIERDTALPQHSTFSLTATLALYFIFSLGLSMRSVCRALAQIVVAAAMTLAKNLKQLWLYNNNLGACASRRCPAQLLALCILYTCWLHLLDPNASRSPSGMQWRRLVIPTMR